MGLLLQSKPHMRICFLAALLVIAPAVARAEAPSVFQGAHVGVEAQFGVATPLGAAGLSLIVAPHERLSLEVGAGLGLTGIQRAAMVRVRPYRPRPMLLLGVGAGLSEGEFSHYYDGVLPARSKHWDRARWASAELNLTITPRRVQVRLFAGYSRQLTPGTGCTDLYIESSGEPPRPCTGSGGHGLYYTGAAVRFATPLDW